jgi:hypothetical protein
MLRGSLGQNDSHSPVRPATMYETPSPFCNRHHNRNKCAKLPWLTHLIFGGTQLNARNRQVSSAVLISDRQASAGSWTDNLRWVSARSIYIDGDLLAQTEMPPTTPIAFDPGGSRCEPSWLVSRSGRVGRYERGRGFKSPLQPPANTGMDAGLGSADCLRGAGGHRRRQRAQPVKSRFCGARRHDGASGNHRRR